MEERVKTKVKLKCLVRISKKKVGAVKGENPVQAMKKNPLTCAGLSSQSNSDSYIPSDRTSPSILLSVNSQEKQNKTSKSV